MPRARPPPASAMTAAPPRPSTGASAPSWCLCARTSMCMAASVVSPLTTACACVFSAGAPCARAESAALFSSTAPLVSGAGTAALTSFPMARRSCRPSAWPSLARSRGISLLLRPSPALLRPCLEAFACPTLSRGSRTPSTLQQSASGARRRRRSAAGGLRPNHCRSRPRPPQRPAKAVASSGPVPFPRPPSTWTRTAFGKMAPTMSVPPPTARHAQPSDQ